MRKEGRNRTRRNEVREKTQIKSDISDGKVWEDEKWLG